MSSSNKAASFSTLRWPLAVLIATVLAGLWMMPSANANHIEDENPDQTTWYVDDDGFVYIDFNADGELVFFGCDAPGQSPGNRDADSRVVIEGPPPSTSNNIQNAVNKASADGSGAGDVIFVCPGNYLESVRIDVPDLRLRTQKAGIHGSARLLGSSGEACRVVRQAQPNPCVVADRGQEASVQGQREGGFIVNSSRVTIDGFLIENCTSGAAGTCSGIDYLGGAKSGHNVRNNILMNNMAGIYLQSDGTTPSTITRNFFLNNNAPGPASGNGIYADSGVSNTTISDNDFSGNPSNSIGLFGPAPGSGIVNSNVTLSSNDLNSTMRLAHTGDSLVTSNSLQAPFGNGIEITGANSNIRFFQNTIDGASASGIAIGTNDSPTANSGIRIESNTIINNSNGIGVFGGIASPEQLTIQFNRIAGNSNAGVFTQIAPVPPATTFVKAENNWWGCNSGPGALGCDVVSSTVDARPWLILTISSSATTLRPGQSAIITATLHRNFDGTTQSDTSGGGLFIPDGTRITFTTERGRLTVDSAETINGVAQTVVMQTAETTPGVARVSAQLDSEREHVDIDMLSATSSDPALPAITISDTTVSEGNGGNGVAVFTVALSRPLVGVEQVQVTYASADGSAKAGEDYSPVAGQLQFFSGIGARQIQVPITADLTFEPDEVFFVNLTNPVGGSLGDDQGLGTIQNDDQPGTQPSPTPTPTGSASPSPTTSASPSPSPSPTRSPSPSPSPTRSPSPTPTPTQTTGPQLVSRELTFRLDGHLRASGVLRAQLGATECQGNAPIKIQKFRDGRYVTVARAVTSPDGTFVSRIRDQRGFYRALAPKIFPDADTTCLRAKSRGQRHRHR